MRWGAFLLGLLSAPGWATEPLPAAEAGRLLQAIADASNRFAYEGVFVLQHGERMQTLRISSQPHPSGRESRLVGMDGEVREVRCTRGESVTIQGGDGNARASKRIISRHFPDLLPSDARVLTEWYWVRPAGTDRVAGQDCREIHLKPKDEYRWGYALCVDDATHLPLRAVLVDPQGQALMRYTFAELEIMPGDAGKARMPPVDKPVRFTEAPKAIQSGAVQVRQLPPGFTRVAAVKRPLSHRGTEVEHWVFSDGLTHVSMFVEPLSRPDITLKGASQKGMVNLLTRRVGSYQITVLGDAPRPTVELIARGVDLASSRQTGRP